MADSVSPSSVVRAIEEGEGVLHLAPAWVPRAFCVPGRRLRLAEEDLYVLGADRGGIDERWFGSTTPADNAGAPPDEGLSYVVSSEGSFTLRDAIAAEGERIIGEALMARYGGWPVYAKFFDNEWPLPHHLHQTDEHARLVGKQGKPEAYYFPPQLNAIGNRFPFTFFGLEPGTRREAIIKCLERYDMGDNNILDLSRAYRLRPGTGWLVPAGLLHAPGSFVTYEVQWASDVFAMFQSMVMGNRVDRSLLVKDVPPGKHDDLEFLAGLVDWEANTDPYFKLHHYLEPVPDAEASGDGYEDRWVIYGRIEGHSEPLLVARELVVRSGVAMTLRDPGASCVIAVQGRGTLGPHPIEAPVLVRYGELTWDEFFITDAAARNGVTVRNTGKEPLVLLRYFGPGVDRRAPASLGAASK